MLELYEDLTDAINRISTVIRFTKIDEFQEVLEVMFSPDQAAVASKMPPGPSTAERIADAAGRTVAETASILETMADDGTVYCTVGEDNPKYSLLPLLPGSWEVQLMKGQKDEKSVKLARLFEKYFEAARESPRQETKTTTVPFSRVIPIAETIEPETEILPYEVMANLLDEVDTISVSHCYCRHEGELLGNPCEKPVENCFNFGPFAEFLAERGFGRLIDREEAKEIMQEAERTGLVHCATNTQGRIGFVCNCCSCHCGIMRSMQSTRGPGMAAVSEFIVKLEEDWCAACEECIDRCQVHAISPGEEAVEIDLDLCIGCGLCVTTCPSEALNLVAREDAVAPPRDYKELATAQAASLD